MAKVCKDILKLWTNFDIKPDIKIKVIKNNKILFNRAKNKDLINI